MGKLSAKCLICNSHMECVNDEYADKFKETIGLVFNIFKCDTCNGSLQAIANPSNVVPITIFNLEENILINLDAHIQWYKDAK